MFFGKSGTTLEHFIMLTRISKKISLRKKQNSDTLKLIASLYVAVLKENECIGVLPEAFRKAPPYPEQKEGWILCHARVS